MNKLEEKWEALTELFGPVNYDVATVCENTELFCKANGINFVETIHYTKNFLNAFQELGAEVIITSDDEYTFTNWEGSEETVILEPYTEVVFPVTKGSKLVYKHCLNCTCCDGASHLMAVLQPC